MIAGKLFADLPAATVPEEVFTILAQAGGTRVERIVSSGQATPPGTWLEQPEVEWVVLLSGRAGLRFEAEPAARVLEPGDWLLIPGHTRHRVELTDPDGTTVWLAVHFAAEPPR